MPQCRVDFEEVCREADGGRCAKVPRRVCVLATELVTKVSEIEGICDVIQGDSSGW